MYSTSGLIATPCSSGLQLLRDEIDLSDIVQLIRHFTLEAFYIFLVHYKLCNCLFQNEYKRMVDNFMHCHTMLYVVDSVIGVTHLDNIMYVVCGHSSTIHLYNTDSQSPLNVINVDGMKDPWDIIVCRDDRQLYIAEDRCIWRVSVDDQSYVKWLTTRSLHCESLSLTSRRLLVPSYWPAYLRQYNTTNSQLLRIVSTPRYMSQLYHGVETTHGTFVVGHWGTPEGECHNAVSELLVLSIINSLHVTQ